MYVFAFPLGLETAGCWYADTSAAYLALVGFITIFIRLDIKKEMKEVIRRIELEKAE